MKIPDLISKKSAIIASALVLIIGAVAVTRKTKSKEVAQSESTAAAEPTENEVNKKAKIKEINNAPLSIEEESMLNSMLEDRGINKKKIMKRFDLGEVEAQQVYNDEFKWTKDRFEEATEGSGTALYSIPISSIRFIEKKSKKVIAQLRIDELDSNCDENIALSNIDVTTPWPEVFFACTAKGSGAYLDLLVLSLTLDSLVLLNTEFSNSISNDKIFLTGNAELRPKQETVGFLNTAFQSANTSIQRSNATDLSEKKSPRTPAYYVIAMPGVESLWNCEQCTLRPKSVIALENGTWKDANKEPAALKYFESSLKEINKNLAHYFDKKNFKPDEEDFRLKTINEAQFLRLAHSIRVDRGADAWKEMNKRFNEKVFKLCNGEKNCAYPNWQAEIKSELEARGFDVSDLK